MIAFLLIYCDTRVSLDASPNPLLSGTASWIDSTIGSGTATCLPLPSCVVRCSLERLISCVASWMASTKSSGTRTLSPSPSNCPACSFGLLNLSSNFVLTVLAPIPVSWLIRSAIEIPDATYRFFYEEQPYGDTGPLDTGSQSLWGFLKPPDLAFLLSSVWKSEIFIFFGAWTHTSLAGPANSFWCCF